MIQLSALEWKLISLWTDGVLHVPTCAGALGVTERYTYLSRARIFKKLGVMSENHAVRKVGPEAANNPSDTVKKVAATTILGFTIAESAKILRIPKTQVQALRKEIRSHFGVCGDIDLEPAVLRAGWFKNPEKWEPIFAEICRAGAEL